MVVGVPLRGRRSIPQMRVLSLIGVALAAVVVEESHVYVHTEVSKAEGYVTGTDSPLKYEIFGQTQSAILQGILGSLPTSITVKQALDGFQKKDELVLNCFKTGVRFGSRTVRRTLKAIEEQKKSGRSLEEMPDLREPAKPRELLNLDQIALVEAALDTPAETFVSYDSAGDGLKNFINRVYKEDKHRDDEILNHASVQCQRTAIRRGHRYWSIEIIADKVPECYTFDKDTGYEVTSDDNYVSGYAHEVCFQQPEYIDPTEAACEGKQVCESCSAGISYIQAASMTVTSGGTTMTQTGVASIDQRGTCVGVAGRRRCVFTTGIELSCRANVVIPQSIISPKYRPTCSGLCNWLNTAYGLAGGDDIVSICGTHPYLSGCASKSECTTVEVNTFFGTSSRVTYCAPENTLIEALKNIIYSVGRALDFPTLHSDIEYPYAFLFDDTHLPDLHTLHYDEQIPLSYRRAQIYNQNLYMLAEQVAMLESFDVNFFTHHRALSGVLKQSAFIALLEALNNAQLWSSENLTLLFGLLKLSPGIPSVSSTEISVFNNGQVEKHTYTRTYEQQIVVSGFYEKSPYCAVLYSLENRLGNGLQVQVTTRISKSPFEVLLSLITNTFGINDPFLVIGSIALMPGCYFERYVTTSVEVTDVLVTTTTHEWNYALRPYTTETVCSDGLVAHRSIHTRLQGQYERSTTVSSHFVQEATVVSTSFYLCECKKVYKEIVNTVLKPKFSHSVEYFKLQQVNPPQNMVTVWTYGFSGLETANCGFGNGSSVALVIKKQAWHKQHIELSAGETLGSGLLLSGTNVNLGTRRFFVYSSAFTKLSLPNHDKICLGAIKPLCTSYGSGLVFGPEDVSPQLSYALKADTLDTYTQVNAFQGSSFLTDPDKIPGGEDFGDEKLEEESAKDKTAGAAERLMLALLF